MEKYKKEKMNNNIKTLRMKKNLSYAALAIMALVSCTSNDYVGDQKALENTETNRSISFGFDVPRPTRATGTEAATALDNQFIVYGEKGPITNAAPTEGNYVFPNYQVNYIDNSSYTTTSNTKGWEYVGYTHSDNYQTNITTKATTEATAVNAQSSAQTIKFWDYGAANYVFTAVSASKADIEAGRVKIQKNEYGSTAYDKGYTITLAKVSEAYPTVNGLFFADRIAIKQSNNSDRSQVNQYGGNVTFNFRNLVSHIRAGIYETIPGYDISDITFYVDNGSGEQTTLAQVNSTDAFGAKCPNISTTNYQGTITVTYYSNSDTEGNENQPKVTATGTPATNLILGTNINTISTSTLLGTTATTPTWDTEGGTFTEVFPQIANSTSLKLKCDYTLWNSVTHETIKVTGATAEVPAMYLQWKPNYKYTYLFKISDNTNGQTGTTGPTGLYPITFDAIEIAADDGKVEYITTVTEPSITTFGVVLDNTDNFKNYVTGKDEYQLPGGTDKLDIYATIMDGTSVLIPQLFDDDEANFVKVYAVDYKTGTSEAEKTEHPITELSVANAIEHPDGLITATHINSATNDYFATAPAAVTTVPGEDGNNKAVNALKLQGVKAAGKYAVEIVTYTAVTLTSGADLNGYYSVDDNGKYSKQTSGTYSSGTYYKQVKAYKVITVVAAP